MLKYPKIQFFFQDTVMIGLCQTFAGLPLCLLAHAQSITLRHGLGLRHAFDMEK